MPADLDHSSYSVPNICRNMKVVFFPYHRLHWEEGLLIGFQRHVGGVDCQVILSSLKPDAELVDNLCEKLRECLYHEHVLQGNIWKSAVLGVWINEKLQQDSVEVLQNKIDRLIGDMSGYKHDLNLVGFAFDEASHVSFLTSERSWSKDKIVCVLYRIPEGSCTDSTEVSFSDEFSFSDGVSLQRFVQECELRLQTGRRTEMVEKCSYTGELLQLVNLVKQSRITTPELTSQIPCRRPVMHFLTVLFFPLSILCKLFLVACHGTCTFLDWLQECSFPKQAFVQFIIQLPVTNQQLLFRLRQLDALYKCCANGGHTNTDIEQDSSSSSGRSKEVPADISTKGLHRKLTQDIRIPQGNVVLGLLLDIVLGFVVVYWLDVNIHSTAVSDFIVDYTEMVVSLLSKLINWMVGAPAGLKLNRELAQFLGKFFHYHIYLWRSYLALIQPYISIIVWYGILSGCLGVTFLFSLASDMLSLVTIHIYCFYAYAARLYSLEIYGLIALARLFTGKKWNVLRKRLDSISYDVDRLFLGTVLFTILLFLLPTVALFYVVFTALRLTVLLAKEILGQCVYAVNCVPLYSLFLYIFHPDLLPGSLSLRQIPQGLQPLNPEHLSLGEVVYRPISPVLYVELYSKPYGVGHILKQALRDLRSCNNGTGEEQCIMKILRGHLVYPWKKTKT